MLYEVITVIPMFREAVEIDSTFAMAWRRLGIYYSNTAPRQQFSGENEQGHCDQDERLDASDQVEKQ